MKFIVKGRVPHQALKGALMTKVIVAEASEIIWLEGDTVQIGHLPYYDAVVVQHVDISGAAIDMRIEALRKHLDDTAPHLLLEYDTVLDTLDRTSPDFPLEVSRRFYDLLERNGKLLDENGNPVFVK